MLADLKTTPIGLRPLPPNMAPIGLRPLPPNGITHLGEDWTVEVEAWLREGGRAEKTVVAYLQDLRHFGRYFEGVNGRSFSPDQLNAMDVKGYFAAQDSDKRVAPTSRNRRLASLRVLVEWAVERGIMDYDPTVSIKRQKFELTPRDRDVDEMARLGEAVEQGSQIRCGGQVHEWLNARDRVLWALFADTGLRIHEVAGLDAEDVDFEAGRIHVLGKGGKKATIAVPFALLDLLADWLALQGSLAHRLAPLITGWSGERLTTGQIRRRIGMIGRAAGIRDLKPHDLRHTYAYRLAQSLIRQGLTAEKAADGVRRQLRHGDMKTTMSYFRVRGSEIRAAVEALR